MLTERFDPTNMQPSYFCQGDFWGLQIIFGEISRSVAKKALCWAGTCADEMLLDLGCRLGADSALCLRCIHPVVQVTGCVGVEAGS